MSASASTAVRFVPRRWAAEAGWWLAAGLAILATVALAQRSPQYGATLVLLVLVLGLHHRSRNAGIVAVWLCWLVLPGVRRVFGLSTGYVNTDPLALAPFVVTAAVAAIELLRTQLTRRAWTVIGLGVAGFGLGLPTGILASPASALFAMFAYVAALSAFVIGHRDATSAKGLTLRTALLAAGPIVAAYGIYQYFAPLPVWDDVWLKSVDFISVGTKEEGSFRIFGTLNAPGTLGAVLAVATLLFLSNRRFTPVIAGGLILVMAALALTFVRSAWVALAVALVVLLVCGRTRFAGRVVVVLALAALSVPFLAGSDSTAQRVSGRFSTLTDLSNDTSANARVSTPLQLVPAAARQPLGIGIGQAGEAARLGGAGGLRYSDNGYLALLYQSGAFGLAAVIAALGLGVAAAWRNLRSRRTPRDVAVASLLAFFLVFAWSGDAFYGLVGVILWYTVGVAIGRDAAAGVPSGIQAS